MKKIEEEPLDLYRRVKRCGTEQHRVKYLYCDKNFTRKHICTKCRVTILHNGNYYCHIKRCLTEQHGVKCLNCDKDLQYSKVVKPSHVLLNYLLALTIRLVVVWKKKRWKNRSRLKNNFRRIIINHFKPENCCLRIIHLLSWVCQYLQLFS